MAGSRSARCHRFSYAALASLSIETVAVLIDTVSDLVHGAGMHRVLSVVDAVARFVRSEAVSRIVLTGEYPTHAR
jgi:hypothetical protein